MENEQEELQKYIALSEDSLNLNFTPPKMLYKTCDGRTFENKAEAILHDKIVSRERFYNHLLENRNWFQKLFNIKPDMSFYDQSNY